MLPVMVKCDITCHRRKTPRAVGASAMAGRQLYGNDLCSFRMLRVFSLLNVNTYVGNVLSPSCAAVA